MASEAPSETASEHIVSDLPLSSGAESPTPGQSNGVGKTYPPYPPYATEPVPASVADTIIAGKEIRLQHKSLPRQVVRPPPKPAKPKDHKVTDVKLAKRAMRAHARCLRRHGAVLTDRLEWMSKPPRRRIIGLWRDHACHLPAETIARLRSMLDADAPFKPDQAYEYFVNLKKMKKKTATGKVNQIKRDVLALCADKRFVWARNATVALARGIQQRLTRPGRYSLADRMLRLSDIVLEEVCSYQKMRPPSRRNTHPKAKFMMEMADKIAVWIDEVLEESDDRMLMMDFDEDEDVIGAGEAGDNSFDDNFLNMMAGGGLVKGAQPAYLKFTGARLEAFVILTDAMTNKGNTQLLSHGKFSQTFAEGADELKRTPNFETIEFNSKLSKQVNIDLTATAKSATPAHLKTTMKEMVETCSNYLAQHAELNSEALDYVVKLMKDKGDVPLGHLQGYKQTYNDGARRIENATSLANDKVDKGTYESVRSKLAALTAQKPAPKLAKQLPGILDVASKFLSSPFPETAMDKRRVLADLISRKENNIIGQEGLYKLTYREGGEEIMNAPVGVTTAHDEAKNSEMLRKINTVIPDGKLADVLKESAKEGAAHLTDIVHGRGEAMKIIHEGMKKEGNEDFLRIGNFQKNHGEAAQMLENANHFGGQNSTSPVILNKVQDKIQALPGVKASDTRHMKDTSEITAKYIAGLAIQDSGLNAKELSEMDATGNLSSVDGAAAGASDLAGAASGAKAGVGSEAAIGSKASTADGYSAESQGRSSSRDARSEATTADGSDSQTTARSGVGAVSGSDTGASGKSGAGARDGSGVGIVGGSGTGAVGEFGAGVTSQSSAGAAGGSEAEAAGGFVAGVAGRSSVGPASKSSLGASGGSGAGAIGASGAGATGGFGAGAEGGSNAGVAGRSGAGAIGGSGSGTAGAPGAGATGGSGAGPTGGFDAGATGGSNAGVAGRSDAGAISGSRIGGNKETRKLADAEEEDGKRRAASTGVGEHEGRRRAAEEAKGKRQEAKSTERIRQGGSDDDDETHRKAKANAKRNGLASSRKERADLDIDRDRETSLGILHTQLKAKGGEIFYKQPQTELSHAQASDWLKKPPMKVDKMVKESADTDRLHKKFERKLNTLVSKATPHSMIDSMQDVVIESSRILSEYFLSSNYKALVREALISEMQKKGNEILVEVDGATETFFFAAQRLKKASTLEVHEPCANVAYRISKKLEEALRCRPMARKLNSAMKDQINVAADFISESATKPDESIAAYVALLGEMEAAGDTLLIEGEIIKSYKQAAAYLCQLTSLQDQINLENSSLQSQIGNQLKNLMTNVTPAGYTNTILSSVINESSRLLVSYIMLQGLKTEALRILIDQLDKAGDNVLLRHGSIRKSYTDGANILRDKSANELTVSNADPVVARKIQIKLNNLMAENTPDKYKSLMDDVIDDATMYLAVNLLRPQIIQVCKCMKNVFVQCELWCDEILRRMARPSCTCSRHMSAQTLNDLASAQRLQIASGCSQALAPGIEISVTTCPAKKKATRQSEESRSCPAREPTSGCNATTAYLLYSSAYNQEASKDSLCHDEAEIPQSRGLSTSENSSSILLYSMPTTSKEFKEDRPVLERKDASSTSSPETYYTPTSTSNTSRDSDKQIPFWQASTTMYANIRSKKSESREQVLPIVSTDRSTSRAITGYNSRTPIVCTDQMGDWHAMMVSLMWNVHSWRDWIQEYITRGLNYQHEPNAIAEEYEAKWTVLSRKVATEALQWRQYNNFSRQLTLRLALRYRNKTIVSPTRSSVKTEIYTNLQQEMMDIIAMFYRWTHWLSAVVKETDLLKQQIGSDVPLHELRWSHFKRKIEENHEDWIKYNMHLKTCWEPKYNSLISECLPSWEHHGPVWVVSACGAVPSGAVAAGVYDGEVAWVARTTHKCDVLPAALHPSKHCCLVYADGAVHHYTKYQVMCNAEVSWLACRARDVCANEGANAIRVSRDVLAGRVLYRGSHLLGVVRPPSYRCHVVIYGRPFAFNCYELLVSNRDSD